MKKYIVLALIMGMMLIGQTAFAAAEVEPLQSFEVIADNNVNIFNYSFFDSASEGRVELYELQNIWGAGAGMRVDVNTDTGADYLAIEVSGAYNGDKQSMHTVSVSLHNKGVALLTAKIGKNTPLVLTITDGKLTVAAGSSKRTVANVISFPGSMMTQSISAKLKVYPALGK